MVCNPWQGRIAGRHKKFAAESTAPSILAKPRFVTFAMAASAVQPAGDGVASLRQGVLAAFPVITRAAERAWTAALTVAVRGLDSVCLPARWRCGAARLLLGLSHTHLRALPQPLEWLVLLVVALVWLHFRNRPCPDAPQETQG